MTPEQERAGDEGLSCGEKVTLAQTRTWMKETSGIYLLISISFHFSSSLVVPMKASRNFPLS